MTSKIRADLQGLYKWYCKLYEPKITSSEVGQSSQVGERSVQKQKKAYKARIEAFKSHLKARDSIEAKNEVERYLAEACVDGDDSFDVLDWWKCSVSRFPILSCIARDVLAIPVSTLLLNLPSLLEVKYWMCLDHHSLLKWLNP